MAFNALWLQNVDYPARIDRTVFDSIWTAGILGSGSLQVSPSSPAGMSVQVAAGVAVVQGTDQVFQGKYLCREQAATLGVAIAAAPGIGSRHDIIVLQVRDPNASGAPGDDAIIAVIQGTASSTPVDPTLPPSSLPLARVRVPSGTGSITAGLIDDLRVASQDAYSTTPAGSIGLAQLTSQVINLLVPTGTVSAFGGSVAPTGWLLCDGSAYTTAAQPGLYAVIGNAYDTSGGQIAPGAGSFRVPLLTGRVAVGRDAAQTEFDALGDTGGVKTVLLTAAQSGLPGHDHSIALSGTTGDNNANHTHGQSGTFTSTNQSANHDHSGVTTTDGSHSHSIDLAGSGNTHSHQSAAASNYAAGEPFTFSGSGSRSGIVNSAGSHQHAFLTGAQNQNHTHQITLSGNTGNNSVNHQHPFSASGTSGTVAAAPASQAHENLQPYAVLNYIIKA